MNDKAYDIKRNGFLVTFYVLILGPRQVVGILLGILVMGFLLTGCTVASVPAAPTAVPPTTHPLPTEVEVADLPVSSTPLPTKMAAATVLSPDISQTPTRAPSLATETAVLAASPFPTATPTATFAAYGTSRVLGRTIENRPIVAYNFGFGTHHLVFVGGMHGGYEWNTIALAYEAIDYFSEHPELIPASVRLTIIPSLNVDGQYLVTGSDGRFDTTATYSHTVPGRFNANEVDLNRNWDCEWSSTALWQSREVSGGEEPFSEPETEVLRRFFLWERPDLVVFWHSKANGVYAAGCPDTYALSLALATIFGEAAGYPVYEDFTAYPVTGDAGNWLALQEIPSFTVELETHTGTDWPQNLEGMKAILEEFGGGMK